MQHCCKNLFFYIYLTHSWSNKKYNRLFFLIFSQLPSFFFNFLVPNGLNWAKLYVYECLYIGIYCTTSQQQFQSSIHPWCTYLSTMWQQYKHACLYASIVLNITLVHVKIMMMSFFLNIETAEKWEVEAEKTNEDRREKKQIQWWLWV